MPQELQESLEQSLQWPETRNYCSSTIPFGTVSSRFLERKVIRWIKSWAFFSSFSSFKVEAMKIEEGISPPYVFRKIPASLLYYFRGGFNIAFFAWGSNSSREGSKQHSNKVYNIFDVSWIILGINPTDRSSPSPQLKQNIEEIAPPPKIGKFRNFATPTNRDSSDVSQSPNMRFCLWNFSGL